MTANELRIDNWVKTPEGIAKVVAIDYAKVRLHRFTEKGNFVVYDEAIEYVSGVPLTEEILLNCGFEKYQWQDAVFKSTCFGDLFIHFYKAKILTSFKKISKDSIGQKMLSLGFIGHNEKSEKFEHLHQLQNLYHALTRKELEVKL